MSSFFNMLDPLLKYIDDGQLFRQPFKWLFYAIGILLAGGCFYAIYNMFDKVEYMTGKHVFFIILMSLILIAVAIFCVVYWFNRAGEIEYELGIGNLQAMPAVALLIRYLGECSGCVIAGAGCLGSLFVFLFFGDDSFGIFDDAWKGIFMCPILGYVEILLSRFLAEMCVALANISNDVALLLKLRNKGM